MYVLSEHYRLSRRYIWYTRLLRSIDKWRVSRLKPQTLICDSQIVEMGRDRRRLVLQILHGGIGDHLAYSALPQLLWEQKKIQVYLSADSVFRHSQIFDYVWAKNPFVRVTEQNGGAFISCLHGVSSKHGTA